MNSTTPARLFRSRSRLALIAMTAALTLAASPLIAAASAAHANDAGSSSGSGSADDVTWTVRTESNAYGKERTGFTYAIAPGQSADDALIVSNRGSEPLDLGVYAADGYTTDAGQLDLVTQGETSTGIGAWTAPGSDRVTVAPGASISVPFHLAVPANATPGDYVGGIVTSLGSTADAGISVDRRLGIRISLRVSGELAPALAIEDPQVSWGGTWSLGTGAATLSYRLHNTGNVTIGAQQAASIGGPFGWFPTAATPDDETQILPGESRDVSVTVPGIAGLGLLVASTSVTPIVVDASGSTTGLEPVTASTTGASVPWLLLIIVVAVAAAAVGVTLLRRRRLAEQRAREDARVEQAVADALASREHETASR